MVDAFWQDTLWVDMQLLLRLVLALALGAAVGWEREESGKAAGLRTHMLVCMGAALFVMLGDLVVKRSSGLGDSIRTDPIRIIEAVVAGISFLGAGTIFVSRGRNQVRGLTTAAAIWTTAGVGIAIGLERYVLAVGATLLVLLVLRLLSLVAEDRDRRETSGTGSLS
jgi:putative Mg2+ transporter-C (MgtC) family protein